MQIDFSRNVYNAIYDSIIEKQSFKYHQFFDHIFGVYEFEKQNNTLVV